MARSTPQEVIADFNALLRSRVRSTVIAIIAVVGLLSIASPSAHAQKLDSLSLERAKKLREVERYQLNIAERYYTAKNWKVAAAEYEKYLTLYERSDAASYSQLKWSLCQVRLRKLNTAIKDGFQSVIDYWPDSPDAIASAYFIGAQHKNMGEIKKAKLAYRKVLEKYPEHIVAAYTTRDLIDITTIEKDVDARVAFWRTLVFKTKRVGDARSICNKASQDLAVHLFYQGTFDEASQALAKVYSETQMPYYVLYYANAPISNLTKDEKLRAKGEKLSDLAVAFVRTKVPTDVSKEADKKRAIEYSYYIADLYSYSRRYDKVIATYVAIEKSYGKDDGTLGRFAGWYIGRGEYDNARKTYARYAEKIEGRRLIATSYRTERKFDLAVSGFQQLIASDPKGIIRWLSEIASTHYTAGKYNDAIKVYQQLLKQDFEHIEQWKLAIATAYRVSGQRKEAIAQYRQCEINTTNLRYMAECHSGLKQYAQAIGLYGQIVGLSTAANDRARAVSEIAQTHERAKNKEAAIRAYQQVCKLFPKTSYASRAHAHLQTQYKISVTLGGGTDDK